MSAKVCKEGEDGEGTLIKIKVVNKTRCMLTNVRYALNFCRSSGECVHEIENIPPCKRSLEFIDKYSKNDENDENAIRFSYRIPPHVRIADGWLEFSIHASHGFSSTSACVKKQYGSDDIISGIFEIGTSMRILAVPNS